MNWRRASMASAVALPLIALLAYGMTRDPKEIPSPLPGKAAPPFNLAVFSSGFGPIARPIGDTLRLAGLKGDVVVVNFWASWCTECHTEQSTLNQTWQRFQDSGVVVVGVNFEDTTDDAIDYVRTASVSYPVVEDSDSRTALAYGLRGVPETFVIDRTGRIVDRIIGPVDATRLTNQITSMLPAGEQ